jgi:O-antigen/teichoic acid export membrane protein
VPPAVRGGLLARNTALNIAGQVIPIAVAVPTIPYVVAGLGDSRFGILALAWAALGYFGVLDLGLGRAATRYIAAALGQGETHRVPALLGSALAVQVVFGILGALALAAAAPWLAATALNVPAELVGETRGALYVIALTLPVVIVTGSVRGALEAAQRFDLINAVTVPASSATFLLPLLGVALGWELPAIILLLFAGRAVTLLALFWLALPSVPGLRTVSPASAVAPAGAVGPAGAASTAGAASPAGTTGGQRVRLRVDREALRGMLGFGGWVMVSNLTVPLLSHLERFLIPALLTVGALTYYAVPFEVLTRVAIVPAAMALTLFPAFSFMDRRDPGAVDELFARPLKYLLLVMTPVLGFIAVFAEPLLGAWLGDAFAARAALPLRILVLAFYLNAFAQIALAALHGLGRPDLKAKLDLVQVPVFMVLLVLFIPRWGIAGAAAAKLAVTVLDVVGLFLFVGLAHQTPAARRYPPPLRRAAGLSLAFAALAMALPLLALPVAPAMLTFLGLATLFAGACWRASVDAVDRAAMARLARRVRGAPA